MIILCVIVQLVWSLGIETVFYTNRFCDGGGVDNYEGDWTRFVTADVCHCSSFDNGVRVCALVAQDEEAKWHRYEFTNLGDCERKNGAPVDDLYIDECLPQGVSSAETSDVVGWMSTWGGRSKPKSDKDLARAFYTGLECDGKMVGGQLYRYSGNVSHPIAAAVCDSLQPGAWQCVTTSNSEIRMFGATSVKQQCGKTPWAVVDTNALGLGLGLIVSLVAVCCVVLVVIFVACVASRLLKTQREQRERMRMEGIRRSLPRKASPAALPPSLPDDESTDGAPDSGEFGEFDREEPDSSFGRSLPAEPEELEEAEKPEVPDEEPSGEGGSEEPAYEAVGAQMLAVPALKDEV